VRARAVRASAGAGPEPGAAGSWAARGCRRWDRGPQRPSEAGRSHPAPDAQPRRALLMAPAPRGNRGPLTHTAARCGPPGSLLACAILSQLGSQVRVSGGTPAMMVSDGARRTAPIFGSGGCRAARTHRTRRGAAGAESGAAQSVPRTRGAPRFWCRRATSPCTTCAAARGTVCTARGAPLSAPGSSGASRRRARVKCAAACAASARASGLAPAGAGEAVTARTKSAVLTCGQNAERRCRQRPERPRPSRHVAEAPHAEARRETLCKLHNFSGTTPGR